MNGKEPDEKHRLLRGQPVDLLLSRVRATILPQLPHDGATESFGTGGIAAGSATSEGEEPAPVRPCS
jgi:hypothetical protein